MYICMCILITMNVYMYIDMYLCMKQLALVHASAIDDQPNSMVCKYVLFIYIYIYIYIYMCTYKSVKLMFIVNMYPYMYIYIYYTCICY
jgi:hypothetical protein